LENNYCPFVFLHFLDSLFESLIYLDSFWIHTWSGISHFSSCWGGNHRGQCWVMSPWLHRSDDDSLQEPLGPLKSQTYDPHSSNSHFPSRHSSIHQDVSNASDLCLCLLILNLCSFVCLSLSKQAWRCYRHTQTQIYGCLISFLCRSWCGHETSSGCAIRNGQAPGGWFKTCSLTNHLLCSKSKSFNIIISRFCPWLFYLSCRIIAPL